jgi:hypothetical protein
VVVFHKLHAVRACFGKAARAAILFLCSIVNRFGGSSRGAALHAELFDHPSVGFWDANADAPLADF